MKANEATTNRDTALKEARTARKMAGYAAETAAGARWAASALIGQVKDCAPVGAVQALEGLAFRAGDMAGRARNAAKNAEAALLAMEEPEDRPVDNPAHVHNETCCTSGSKEWIEIADKASELKMFAERMAEVSPNLTKCFHEMKKAAAEVGEQGGWFASVTASGATSGLTMAEIEEDYLFRILDGLGELEEAIDAMEPEAACEKSSTAPAAYDTKECPFRLSCQAVDAEMKHVNDFIAERINASAVLARMLCEAKGEPVNHESTNRYYNMALAEVRGIPYESMKSE